MRVHIIVTVDQPEYELRKSEEVVCSGSGGSAERYSCYCELPDAGGSRSARMLSQEF